MVRRQFHVHVENTEVYLGNSALIKCAIPEYVRPYVRVASWHRGEEILLPDLSDVGECCHILTTTTNRKRRSEGVYLLLKFMCTRFIFVACQQWSCTFCTIFRGYVCGGVRVGVGGTTGRMTFIGKCYVYAACAMWWFDFPLPLSFVWPVCLWFPNSGSLCGPVRLRGLVRALRAFWGCSDEV